MMHFVSQIQTKLAIFSAYAAQKITISSEIFTTTTGTVADFVREIEQTSRLVATQTDPIYLEFHSKRLIEQFDLLKKAVDKLQAKPQQTVPQFKSRYRFAKNIAKLPVYRQREEYQNALRALNEKISWLIEQLHCSTSAEQKAIFQSQIAETEFRKQKCINALEKLN